MVAKVYHFFLMSAVIGCSDCTKNWQVVRNKSSLYLDEKMMGSLRLNLKNLDKVVGSDSETYRRMERLARCVERVNRASFERKVGVFYHRNFVSQETLVTKYLQRISHDLDVVLYGNWTEDSGDNSIIHNFVLFLHNLESLSEIDGLLGRQMVDRKGKFVICISSTLWTEMGLVVLANSLWKSKVVNAVILVSDVRGLVRIYAYSPVEPKECRPSKVFVLVDDCDDRNFNAKNLFVRKMRNMNLCTVVASSLSLEGATTVYTENGTRKVGGFEGTVFNTIAEKMNFTRVITPVPTNLWGDKLPNGTWNGIHGNIMTGVADVGFCLMFPAVSRLHFEEYSNAILTDRYMWILPKPLPTNWNKVLLPFELSVWLAALAAMTAALGVMYLITQDSKEHPEFGINLWGITLGQSLMKPDNRRLMSYFLLCWTIFSFVLTNAYQSGLVGFLTATSTARRLTTVQELLDSGIPFGGARTPAEVYNHPEDPEDFRVYQNYRFIPISKYLNVIFNVIYGKTNFAALVIETTLRAGKFSGSWYSLKEAALYYPSPFVFPRGSPYIEEFNIQITRLVESGLIDHWIRSNKTGTIPNPGPSHIPLTVIHVSSVFILWIVGISISSLTFLAESLWHRRRQIKKKEGTSERMMKIGSHFQIPDQPAAERIGEGEDSIQSISIALSRRQRTSDCKNYRIPFLLQTTRRAKNSEFYA